MPEAANRWDVFCRVVDHFGDAGVSFRLARLLAREHDLAVTLWIDDLRPLARIVPAIDVAAPQQRADGVEVRRWPEPFGNTAPADVVVEAFACGLPDACVDAMARAQPVPRWFRLEYLATEPALDALHGMPSPEPRLGLPRTFFVPGFDARSGGLPRERDLFARRDALRDDPRARDALWRELGIDARRDAGIRVTLFGYPDNPAIADLFEAWAEGDDPVTCIVPAGVASRALDAWTGGAIPAPGSAPLRRGRLSLAVIEFLALDDFDRLLFASDLNLVRGEDSFVRAQWAARPFAWSPYPQARRAHFAKRDAFLLRYSKGLDAATAAAARRFFAAWNGELGSAELAAAWADYAVALPALTAHGRAWADRLAAQRELAAALVEAAQRPV